MPASFQAALEEVLAHEQQPAAPAAARPNGLWDPFPCSDRMPPAIDRATWRLIVDGAVEQPLQLSYEDIQRLLRRRHGSDLRCQQGPVVADIAWEGAPLDHVLALARVRPEATHVVAYAPGWQREIPLAAALQEGALLAYAANGQTLPPEQGAPLRLVLPTLPASYGVKWLERLELTAVEPAKPT